MIYLKDVCHAAGAARGFLHFQLRSSVSKPFLSPTFGESRNEF